MSASKDKKTGKWKTEFRYKDRSGNTKRVHKRGFKTKKEALEYEKNFKAKYEGSLSMLFQEFAFLFIEDKKHDWKASSKQSNEGRIKNWIIPYFKDKPLIDIKPLDIRNYQNELLENSGLSKSTLNKIRKTLSSIFNYAVKYYDLAENPCNKVDTIKADNSKKVNFWTYEEFKEFMKYVDNESYRIAYETLYFTGIRLGELTALTIKDFDFSVPKLTVNKNYQVIEGKELFLEPKTPKSKRDVILPSLLAEHIQDYIKRFYTLSENDRIFHLNRSSYGNKLREICRKYGLKRIKLHDLRHSHASHLIELGYNPVLIAERLGHDNVAETLNTYSHLYPNKQNEVALELDNYLKNLE